MLRYTRFAYIPFLFFSPVVDLRTKTRSQSAPTPSALLPLYSKVPPPRPLPTALLLLYSQVDTIIRQNKTSISVIDSLFDSEGESKLDTAPGDDTDDEDEVFWDREEEEERVNTPYWGRGTFDEPRPEQSGGKNGEILKYRIWLW